MKRIAMIALAAALAGCATLDGLNFDNRIACSVARDKAFVVSEWGGRVGISSTIADADRAVICR